ncbi:MAG: universal stress protein [Mucilaginibacter sp.]
MKKISAAFDGLRFSQGTLEYALHLAQESKAMLSGVFLEDFLYHSYYALGAAYTMSTDEIEILERQDQTTRLQAVNDFENACKKIALDPIVHRDKGFSIMDLLKETVYSDLLLIGANETLDHAMEKQPSSFLQELLADTQCPVMVVPAVYRPIERLILLYDGKPSSVFAIKMFSYLLPWLQHLPAEIVTVTDHGNDGVLPENQLIKEFLNIHYPAARVRHLVGKPAEQISAYIKDIPESALVVLGAYERSPVSRWFRASMADILLKVTDKPLFIAHCKNF